MVVNSPTRGRSVRTPYGDTTTQTWRNTCGGHFKGFPTSVVGCFSIYLGSRALRAGHLWYYHRRSWMARCYCDSKIKRVFLGGKWLEEFVGETVSVIKPTIERGADGNTVEIVVCLPVLTSTTGAIFIVDTCIFPPCLESWVTSDKSNRRDRRCAPFSGKGVLHVVCFVSSFIKYTLSLRTKDACNT